MDYEVSNLVIYPTEVKAGEAISIRADITNLSGKTMINVVSLWIDGTVETGQDILMKSGDTKPILFNVVREAAGTYEVRLDRCYGSFSVTDAEVIELPPILQPAFITDALTISPAEVDVGEQVVG